jgi:hypothetical protein
MVLFPEVETLTAMTRKKEDFENKNIIMYE